MLRPLCIAGLVGSALLPSTSDAYVLTVEPVEQGVFVGDTFEIQYWVRGLGDHGGLSLAAFDLTMDFDDSLLSYHSIQFGDALGDVGAGQAITSSSLVADGVRVTETSLLSPAELIALQPESFAMFKVAFTARAVGDVILGSSSETLDFLGGGPFITGLAFAGFVHIRQAQPIPALSPWGVYALIGAFMLTGVLALRRHG